MSQFKAISSGALTADIAAQTDAHLITASLEGVVESDDVLPAPSLETEPHQLPQR